MKKQLEIKPVLRYNKAKYPKYTDPNPLDDPKALPYPFSQRILDWAMTLGIFGVTACQGVSQEVGNTFTFDKTGLPYVPAIFGTGMPDRLSGKEMREIALRICQEEGLNIKENVPWVYSDAYTKMGFTITFFDAEKKIGLAILDHQNTEQNSIIDQTYSRIPKPVLNAAKLDGMWIQFADGNPDFSLSGWLDMEKQALWDKDEKAFYKLFNKATFSGLSEKEEEDRKWLFYKILFKNKFKHEKNTFFNKPAIEKALKEENWIALQQALDLNFFINLLHKLIHPKEWEPKTMEQYIADQEAWLAENPGRQSNATNVLAELKDLFFIDTTVKTALQSLFKGYRSDWKEVIWDIREKYQVSRFNLDEVKALDDWAEEKELFVAPISFEDDRFKYYYTEKELMENEIISKNPTELQRAKMLVKEVALQRLEESLRMYIRWAKSQGKY